MAYDLLIKNGTVVDGTQAPRFLGDIAIKDGIIAEIGGDIPAHTAGKVIDAQGKMVAPGVVDLHTHYDAQVHWDPHCTNSSWHGATTVGIGNCGFGFAPCAPEARERSMLMMETTEQIPANILMTALPWTWESFPEWLDHLRSIPKGVNIASFLPLNSLMIYVMGIDAAKTRAATPAERKRMADLLNEAMDAGAIGFAFSFQEEKNGHTDFDGTPMPTDVMDPEEAYLLGEVLRERGEGVIQCLVDMPGMKINRGIIEELAERSGRPILHNILMVVDQMPEFHQGVLEFLDEMEAKGHNVYSQAMSMHTWTEFNFVDYNFWDAVDPVFKEFSLSGGLAEKLKLAADPDYQARFRAAYDPMAMMGAAGGSIESFKLVNAAGYAPYAGKEGTLLGDIAEDTGMDIVDLFFDIFLTTEGKVEVRTTVVGSECPDTIGAVLKHPRVMFGSSDGGAHIKYFSGGQFSTDVISWLGRDEGKFTLEELHYKLSYLTARFAGLKKRGALLEGYHADIMIYDLAEIGCRLDRYDVVNDLPDGSYRRVVYAEGIETVICNGEITVQNGELCSATPGVIVGPDAKMGHPAQLMAAE